MQRDYAFTPYSPSTVNSRTPFRKRFGSIPRLQMTRHVSTGGRVLPIGKRGKVQARRKRNKSSVISSRLYSVEFTST